VTILWIVLGVHTALFWFGIIFPVLWIIGAIMQPTPAVAAAEARASLE